MALSSPSPKNIKDTPLQILKFMEFSQNIFLNQDETSNFRLNLHIS